MTLPEALERAAFEQAPSPTALTDGLGRPALWNAAFERMLSELGCPEAGSLPGSLFDLIASREGTRLDFYAAKILLGGSGGEAPETSLRAANGALRRYRITLSPVEPAEGRLPGSESPGRWLLCSFENVTGRWERERRLLDAKEEAEKATHTKSLFLANMSHEIRTPIQTILGVVELMQETSLDDEQSEYVNQVRFSADVLLGLINDILDFSKIEAGKFDLETASFDLRALAARSADMLVMDAHRKGLEVVVDIDDELPGLVRGDEGRLRQIIVNLMKNAVKFTSEGSVCLDVRKVVGPAGPRVRVEVADTGPGVPEAMRERLFTPFYQGDFAQARKSGGTGLGLAISRRLVELMGGDIGLQPALPGSAGSIFWFEIPLVAPEYSAAPKVIPVCSDSRILVVDDHPRARAHACRLARLFGCQVTEAASGEEALGLLSQAAAQGRPFELCLIDQNMPGMDGWRLANAITGDTSINEARLILMVPVGTRVADAKMMLLKWFDASISKPLRQAELRDAIARALSQGVDLESAEPEEVHEGPDKGFAERFAGTVLIAEDHEVNRELFTVLLERFGCEVTTARDGVEAVEIGSSRPFDIVLMDIFMPRMDGYEASKRLREKGYRGPIIAVTASALKGERENCIAAGMDDILVKPFKKQDLRLVLAAHLGHGGQAEKPGAAVNRSAAPTDPGATDPADAVAPSAPAGAMEPGPQDNLEVFDWEGVVDTFLGQTDTVASLLGRFTAKATAQCGELGEALDQKDLTRFREIAHSLKGASWNLSAKRLGDAARAAEDAGRNGDLAAAPESLRRVKAAFAEFAVAAAPYVKS